MFVFDPVLDTVVGEDRLRHVQLLARAAVGEHQSREDVQEREEAAVPGERGSQHSTRVRAHLVRVPQRHRAVPQPEPTRQVPRDDPQAGSAGPAQAQSQGLRAVHLRGGREEPAT